MENSKCPVCNQPLREDQDVVICPECGAPYHRECYRQAGHCLFEDKHGTGFEYRAPQAEPEPQAPGQAAPPPQQQAAGQGNANPGPGAPPYTGANQNTGGVLCKNCNTVNDSRNIFCERCGYPLHGRAAEGNGSPYGPGVGGNAWPNQPYGNQGAFGQDTMLEGEIDGIPKREWAEYIGNAAPTYLMRMDQMDQRGGKISFMFSAFIVPQFFFAYRKLWLWAILALVVELVVGSVNILWMVADAGVQVLPMLTPNVLYTMDYICSIVMIVVRALSGIFALYLYRKDAVKKMEKLRQECGESPMYHERIRKAGGVSVVGVVLLVAAVFVFSLLLLLLMGTDAVLALYGSIPAVGGLQF